jgi:pimeloyl-ACP methyl ester carboxylesterase
LPIESPDVDRIFADACTLTSGSKLPFVGTDSAAEDLESVRRALGEEQISYLGVSYGTYLGTLYLQKYPDRIRAAVLDAAVDGSVFGVQFIEDQLRGYERTLSEFTKWCQGNTQCLLSTVTPNVQTRIDEMLYIASQTGIGPERISSGALERIMVRLLGESWPTLGALLGDLSRGRTRSTRVLFGSFDGDQAEGETDGSYEAIGCLDGLFPSARPEDGADRLSRFNASAPHFLSYARYWGTEAVCTTWSAKPRVRATPAAAPTGRVLVIGNTLDVRTPIEWAQRLSAQLGAPLVTFDSYLHSASFEGDVCVSKAVSSLLIDRVSPPSQFCA